MPAKGQKLSLEARKKISESQKIKSHFHKYNKTEVHKQKVMISNTERVLSQESKDKIAASLIGKSRSIESRKKQSATTKGKYIGPKNHNWKGKGGNIRGYNWRCVREEVKKRDKYTCQGTTCSGKSKQLHVHHIDEIKQNSILTNLITLCKSCHCKLHPRGFIKTVGNIPAASQYRHQGNI